MNSELKYDEFGTLKNPESIKTSGILFAYTGYAYEETTGLYYAKARYYDSQQGRFLSEDSYRGDISNPISLNLYTYCSNSPILNSDPSGNKIRLTQYDNFLRGFVKGAIAEFDFNVFGSLKQSLVNLDAMGDLIQDIVSGKITDKELLSIGINVAVGDLQYVIKNWHVVSSKKTYSNATVYKFGKHLAGAYGEIIRAVATVVFAVKIVKGLKAKIKGAIKAKNTKPSNAKGASKTWFPKATKPIDYLKEALNRQGLKNAPNTFKEKWSEYGYDFEIRIHPAETQYGKTGSIYRVARRKQGINANGQGFGWECIDEAGNWYSTSMLKTRRSYAHSNTIERIYV